ncbi:MAG TPA: TolC family protein [Steroidobacteraceae bacterium]|nr:TolC family protein [Steroidobacteraceae bacterium]
MRAFPLSLTTGTVSALLLALTACAHFERQPLLPDRIAENYSGRSLTDEGLRSFLQTHAPELAQPWPRASWDLPALTLVAFFFQPDLEVARAQWQTAKATIETASMRPNPAITLTPGYNFNARSGTSPWLPGISVDIPVETSGKRRIRIGKAEHLAESARLNIIGAAWRVRGALRTALIDFTAAQRRMSLLRDQLAIQQRVVELLQQRVTLGAASAAELSPARLALTRVQLDAAGNEVRLADAANKLARSLGAPVQAVDSLPLDFSLDTIPAVDVAQARRLALQYRADIAAGLAEYAASEADLQAEIAKQYPDLHLGPAYEWDQGESKWSLAVGFEVPLNRNRGAIAEARARREESAARFRALEAGVIADVDQASVAYMASSTQMKRIREVHAALEDEASRQRARLSAGDIDQLEYQSARLEAALSGIALLDSEAQAAQAAGMLEDELQRPITALDALDASARGQPSR